MSLVKSGVRGGGLDDDRQGCGGEQGICKGL